MTTLWAYTRLHFFRLSKKNVVFGRVPVLKRGEFHLHGRLIPDKAVFVTGLPADRLANRSFTFFISTQFLGAFNDNIFKQLLLLTAVLTTGTDRQGIVTVVFALPFILFSGYAGQFSERHSKTDVMRLSKVGELIIMLLGALGFYWQSFEFLLVALFLMGTQSAFFGPAKYGAIPELLVNDRLVAANGVVQMTTMGAIIFGLALAGFLGQTFEGRLHIASMACAAISVFGILSVYLILPLEANRPKMKIHYNPFSRVWQSLKEMAADRPLLLALIASTYFYFSGALVTVTVNNYGLSLLNLGQAQTSYLLAWLGLGTMIGCILTSPLQRAISGKWTIFVGAAGVAVVEFLLFFYGLPLLFIKVLMFLAGFFAGLYFVPIASFMQSRPPMGKKGEILAAVNFSNFVGILLSGVFWSVLMAVGLSAHYVWWILSGLLALLLFIMFPQLKTLET